MAKEKKIRVWALRGRINREREKEGKEEIGRKELIDHINDKYGLELKNSSVSGIPPNLNEDIISDFVDNPTQPLYDSKEHIYLKFLRPGNFSVSINLKDSSQGNINIITSPAGTTDLGNLKDKMIKEMREYADYCIRAYQAKEISYEEFLKYSGYPNKPKKGKPPLRMDKNKYTGKELLREESFSGSKRPPQDVEEFGRYDKI
jgi:hypothetical protein